MIVAPLKNHSTGRHKVPAAGSHGAVGEDLPYQSLLVFSCHKMPLT
jgi:hypothetical protein